jgi:hypothetical protein
MTPGRPVPLLTHNSTAGEGGLESREYRLQMRLTPRVQRQDGEVQTEPRGPDRGTTSTWQCPVQFQVQGHRVQAQAV